MREIIVFGSPKCSDCMMQKTVLDNKVDHPYKFIDIESEEIDDIVLLSKYNIDDIPTIVIADEDHIVLKHGGVLASRKILEALNS